MRAPLEPSQAREDTRHADGERRLQRLGLLNGVVLFVAWTPLA